ncbi:MAG TPA: fused MFS/spermidine synthase [Polyangiaceae bacterium]|nr:fused MFS/spermidine synthase [Polyangiaceae bacterium]
MQGTSTERRGPALAVACLYFLSGVTGLVYEVTFSKYLSYVFGATAYASSAVLVAFMGGLSAGGVLVARWNDRIERRYFFYGAAEILVGCFCAASPWLFAAIGDVYVTLARALPASVPVLVVVRWLLATAVVVVPAAGMGATLPLLAPALAGDGENRWLSRLYALNVLGGAAGSLLAAYFIVPALGLGATMRAAAVVNVAIGATAIALGRRRQVIGAPREERPISHAPPDAALMAPSTRRTTLFVLAAGSGLLVFAAEVVYVHLLALVIGTSVYAFGLMLAIFLVCLGVGAAIAPVIYARTSWSAPLAAGFAGLALAATVPIWDRLPQWFDVMAPHAPTWALRETARGLVAFVALVAPATAMGALFPIVLRSVAERADVGAEVGRLTALNTLGSIVGSVLGGFLLLPRWGSQTSLLVIAGAYAALSLAAVVTARGAARRRGGRELAIGTALATVVIALVAPRWDLVKLTSGANVYFESGPEPEAIEMVREDVHGGVTTVVRSGDMLTLYTNGKFQGNNGYELEAQRAFAHIPCLLAERHERAFTIGLGTGTTAGTLAAYPFRSIQVAEISPAIAFAAQKYFSNINGGVFADPRFALLNEDGRNALLVSTERYDVIGIEISSIWFAGAANLYSREFYAIVRGRLAAGGVLQQWVQFHHMGRRELASVLATVRSVFAHVALFAHGNQGIILAGESPLIISRARADAFAARPSIAALLEGAELRDLAADLLVTDDALDRFVADSAKEAKVSPEELWSTDDNLYLEYATPKNNVAGMPSIEQTIEMVARYRPDDVAAERSRP